MKETIFAACIEISSHPSFSRRIASTSPVAGTLGSIGFPEGAKPRISMPTLDVRPVSSSCLCRKRPTRARPRPSSSTPRVRTPNVVDLPLSTLPTTAHRTSGVRETFGGGRRSKTAARGCPSLTSKRTKACGRSVNCSPRSKKDKLYLSADFFHCRLELF